MRIRFSLVWWTVRRGPEFASRRIRANNANLIKRNYLQQSDVIRTVSKSGKLEPVEFSDHFAGSTAGRMVEDTVE